MLGKYSIIESSLIPALFVLEKVLLVYFWNAGTTVCRRPPPLVERRVGDRIDIDNWQRKM